MNCSSHTEELIHEKTSIKDSKWENCPKQQDPILDGSSNDNAAKSGNDEEEGESGRAGEQSIRYEGNEDHDRAEPDSSKDNTRDEEYTV